MKLTSRRLYIGVNSVEVKTEADDVSECSADDQPTTGLSGLLIYCVFCITLPLHHVLYCIMFFRSYYGGMVDDSDKVTTVGWLHSTVVERWSLVGELPCPVFDL